MPTGYTAKIEDGSIKSAKDFLMLCARAFGACIEMRDEPLSKPIPEDFKPDDYYLNEIKEAEKRLENILSLTTDEAQRIIDEEYEKNQRVYAKCLEEAKQKTQKYNTIRSAIDKWQPPTPEHEGLKRFALEQIDMSNDGWANSYYEKEAQMPKADVAEWLQVHIESGRESLENAKKRWQAELENVANKNNWVGALRESLTQI